jgi:hypothetical protein
LSPSLVNIIISDGDGNDNDGKNLIRTDFVYIEFIGNNLKVSHHHYVCYCWLTNNISCRICTYAMIYLHIKFQESSLNGILIITIKQNIKYRFHGTYLYLIKLPTIWWEVHTTLYPPVQLMFNASIIISFTFYINTLRNVCTE